MVEDVGGVVEGELVSGLEPGDEASLIRRSGGEDRFEFGPTLVTLCWRAGKGVDGDGGFGAVVDEPCPIRQGERGRLVPVVPPVGIGGCGAESWLGVIDPVPSAVRGERLDGVVPDAGGDGLVGSGADEVGEPRGLGRGESSAARSR